MKMQRIKYDNQFGKVIMSGQGENMRALWKLFLVFMKIGGLTFGGGYAMLPMLQREIVERYQWATEEELADYYAIGQCTPGIITVNTATFIGYRRAGVVGGMIATLGVIVPSLVIVTMIAAFLINFAELPVVQYAFEGIRVCVCVLILQAVRKMWKSAVIDKASFLIFGLVFLASAGFSILGYLDIKTVSPSPVVYVIIAGMAGIVLCRRKGKRVSGK